MPWIGMVWAAATPSCGLASRKLRGARQPIAALNAISNAATATTAIPRLRNDMGKPPTLEPAIA